ncbi:MAG TPA: glycosyltransferase [Candidatus Acidoferrales bacterium]|nr:glycosyltransferase [Candidatus Acidoferrales bacterium]
MSGTLTFRDISTVIVNYRTPDLLETSARSFRKFYPDVELVIVDNGSNDQSVEVIESFVRSNPSSTKSIMLEQNYFHGPAMDRAARSIEKEIVFFLDTDTETRRGGFVELMLDEFNQNEKVYGVGKLDKVNKRGFAAEDGTITVLLSPYMMLRRKVYFDLPPFRHHGMPTLENFSAAESMGYLLRNFDISDYIEHYGRGTASKFGYSLGFRGKLDFLLNKVGL